MLTMPPYIISLSIILFLTTISFPLHGVEILFVDKTNQSGLQSFKHRMGHKDKRWIIDAMGSGVAVGDYDNDGDDDLYFVNGQPEFGKTDPSFHNTLFQNNRGIFKDVTSKTGVGDCGWGMCAAFGDVDNDGWLDLFVGNYGPNRIYKNNGNGTFTEMTEECGLSNHGYAASASFADYDRDGDLDLFVGNYVDFDPNTNGSRQADYFGLKVFLGPLSIPPQRDHLYVNDGTGHFLEMSARSMINVSLARAMGSAFFDLENDGWLDLYVTNDSTYNHILKNTGDGRFKDLSFESGGGFSDDGRGGASMGVSTGDYNNDGLLDLYITSYENESDFLYRNNGDGTLEDITAISGLFGETLSIVTWGNGFCDFDADGYLDLYTVNGHVYPQVVQLNRLQKYNQGISIYHQKAGRFEEVTTNAFQKITNSKVLDFSGRGSALLDYDSDGDMDLVVNCMDDSPRLFENQSPQGNWLKVKLIGTSAKTFGTRVTAKKEDTSWTQIVDGGSGYLSQNSQILQFGFGDRPHIDQIVVYWPHCEPQIIQNPELNQTLTISAP